MNLPTRRRNPAAASAPSSDPTRQSRSAHPSASAPESNSQRTCRKSTRRRSLCRSSPNSGRYSTAARTPLHSIRPAGLFPGGSTSASAISSRLWSAPRRHGSHVRSSALPGAWKLAARTTVVNGGRWNQRLSADFVALTGVMRRFQGRSRHLGSNERSGEASRLEDHLEQGGNKAKKHEISQ